MQTAVEISLYPLTPGYTEPIVAFIRTLQATKGLAVAVSPLSTQLAGDYDLVMDTLKEAMRPVMDGDTTVSFVLKVLNVEIVPGERVEL